MISGMNCVVTYPKTLLHCWRLELGRFGQGRRKCVIKIIYIYFVAKKEPLSTAYLPHFVVPLFCSVIRTSFRVSVLMQDWHRDNKPKLTNLDTASKFPSISWCTSFSACSLD